MTRPYTQRDIATASGENLNTIKQWLNRRLPIGDRNEASKLVEAPYNFRTIMEFAVASELARRGVPLSLAFAGAVKFTHLGCEKREPALPYSDGETLLVLNERNTRVIYLEAHVGLRDLFPFVSETSAIVVHANPIFDRVCAALGLHPQEVLESAGSS